MELGRRLLPRFADGAWVADLGTVADPALVPAAVAAALGLANGPEPLKRLAVAVGAKRLLLVLDNCAHVIDAAASSAEALLQAGASLRVIATSRELLRADGERVYQVPPLDLPPPGTAAVEQLLRYSAPKLFVARLQAAGSGLVLDEPGVVAIAEICRHLDGKPLAIELAAARAAELGVQEIARHLEERFALLTGGRRTAPPRQQTLRATLDWSYDLLREPERAVMRRLSIFGRPFTMEEAGRIATGEGIDARGAAHHVASLVTKSLVVSDVCGPAPLYRMRETTRAYAREKLADSGEFETVARRLAALEAASCTGEAN